MDMLEVTALTKYYGALAAVHDLSFSVRPGEVIGLLGPNGSGKSTTVKMLAGLLVPTSGAIRLDGQEIFSRLAEYTRSLGYVPEEPHLYSYMTGPEYLMLVGRLRGLDDAILGAKIEQFLQLLGIYDDRYQTLSSYSKGMRQKVLIAAAVVHEPRVVILDEPFSGLDVTTARMLKAFVRALAADGTIIVFSSHVLEVGGRGPTRAPAIIPWLPTFWFVALFERLLGPARPTFEALWPRAVWSTAVLLLAAIAVSIAGYRRQLQRALVPASDPRAAGGSARLFRAVARLFGSRDSVFRVAVDFILVTLVRGRPQQTLVAINTAIAAPILAAALSSSGITLASLMRPRTIVLWIPLAVVYWMAIGLRASFYLPNELPASWTFGANAPDKSRAYRDATRASLLGLLVPAGAAATLATTPFVGWRIALAHAMYVVVLTGVLVEILVLTVHHLPFTRAYPPGHAKLKTRWPLYLIGFWVFAYWPVRVELLVLGTLHNETVLIGTVAAALGVLVLASRGLANNWSVRGDDDDPTADADSVAVLDLSQANARSVGL